MSGIWARQVGRIRLATGAVLISSLTIMGCSLGKQETVKSRGGLVTIPVTKLSDGKAKFYKMAHNGKVVSFFAVKTSDGSYKTAFDACDSCFKDKKGYEQQGDQMNCTNCNQKFAVDRLGPNATGGCNPGYLPNIPAGNSITILESDLAAGGSYF